MSGGRIEGSGVFFRGLIFIICIDYIYDEGRNEVGFI